jgi:hypothetical protein
MNVVVPTDIRIQIADASEFFAIVLKNREAGDAEEIPDWLSMNAQRWIANNGGAFSKMVLQAYQRLSGIAQATTRPTFILPDPEQGNTAQSVVAKSKR